MVDEQYFFESPYDAARFFFETWKLWDIDAGAGYGLAPHRLFIAGKEIASPSDLHYWKCIVGLAGRANPCYFDEDGDGTPCEEWFRLRKIEKGEMPGIDVLPKVFGAEEAKVTASRRNCEPSNHSRPRRSAVALTTGTDLGLSSQKSPAGML